MSRNYRMPTSVDFACKMQNIRASGSAPTSRRSRCLMLFAAACFWVCVVIARLFSLQIADFSRWQEWAARQHVAEIQHLSERGPLLDRNQRLLAVSVPAGSVYVRPRLVSNKQEVSRKVAELLEVEPREVLAALQSPKPFVWVRRQIPRAVAEKVAALKIAGVDFVLESRRLYPYNQAASALIGKVGLDGNGLSGLELSYERHLRGDDRKSRVERDAIGNVIEISEAGERFEPPRGNALQLTIDAGLQMIMDEELEAGRQAQRAEGAMAVMLDAESGEILGMSQSPQFNFNDARADTKTALRNLVVETVFEPGSIMKPLVAAAALEQGVVAPHEVIFCENGRLRFARKTIRDVHPYGNLTFNDVVVRSSNIGMTKVGVRLGRDQLYTALKKFGFGNDSRLNLPGETTGILRPPGQWAQIDVATHSFGQGVAVTPLQMVRAFAAIANGGRLPSLRIVDQQGEFEQRRVISENTARKVQAMLVGVVEDEHGTGGQAAVPGIRIGGKTGTAQKARSGARGYESGAYVASFVGFADASQAGVRQLLALIVAVDEPRGTSIYGGTVAAPIFKRIVERSIQYLATKAETGAFPLDRRDPLMPFDFKRTALSRS